MGIKSALTNTAKGGSFDIIQHPNANTKGKNNPNLQGDHARTKKGMLEEMPQILNLIATIAEDSGILCKVIPG